MIDPYPASLRDDHKSRLVSSRQKCQFPPSSFSILQSFQILISHLNQSFTSFTIPRLSLPKMPSSKGKPTDPKLREKVKEDVKQDTNKDGGGKGQWSAWKVNLHFSKILSNNSSIDIRYHRQQNSPKNMKPKAVLTRTKPDRRMSLRRALQLQRATRRKMMR